MMPASILRMLEAGRDIPYAFSIPGSPSSREANSFSTQTVTADGFFFERAATSESVRRWYLALFLRLMASAYVLLRVDGFSQVTPFFRSASRTAFHCSIG